MCNKKQIHPADTTSQYIYLDAAIKPLNPTTDEYIWLRDNILKIMKRPNSSAQVGKPTKDGKEHWIGRHAHQKSGKQGGKKRKDPSKAWTPDRILKHFQSCPECTCSLEAISYVERLKESQRTNWSLRSIRFPPGKERINKLVEHFERDGRIKKTPRKYPLEWVDSPIRIAADAEKIQIAKIKKCIEELHLSCGSGSGLAEHRDQQAKLGQPIAVTEFNTKAFSKYFWSKKELHSMLGRSALNRKITENTRLALSVQVEDLLEELKQIRKAQIGGTRLGERRVKSNMYMFDLIIAEMDDAGHMNIGTDKIKSGFGLVN